MRAPFNSLVIRFYRVPGAPTLYCVLRRADAGFWQWVAGGGGLGDGARGRDQGDLRPA